MIYPNDSRGGEELFRLEKPALIAGALGLAGLLFGAFTHTERFFRSYLMGWIPLVMIAVGALGVLMLQYLTGGRWGVLLRRPAEAAVRTIPLVALLFLPVVFGIHSIFEWSHAEVLAHDKLIAHKQPYLNPTFFTVRGVLYFVIWAAMGMMLLRWSRQLDEHVDGWVQLRMRKLSGIGLVILALTATFASVDWMMSLEPHWFSTMYGISFIIGCLLAFWAVGTISVVRLSLSDPYASIVKPMNFRDLGNLMFAFTMLWAYTAFSQFLLIWYGNVREETPYYVTRSQGGWGVLAAILLVFHFFLPFFLLLMRQIKDRPSTLGKVAVLMLVMRLIDVFWLMAPALAGHHDAAAETGGQHATPFHLDWMDPLAFIGLLGLWFFFYLRNLRQRSLLPEWELKAKEAHSHA